jgi:Cu/Ag efflux protein CusF
MRLLAALAVALLACMQAPAAAQPAASAEPAAPVHTRAVVRSIFTEDGGKRLYVALKLVPRGKIPFSTITHRVLDRKLLEGIKEGDSVGFTARRIDGENVVTAIQRMAPCRRFETCE